MCGFTLLSLSPSLTWFEAEVLRTHLLCSRVASYQYGCELGSLIHFVVCCPYSCDFLRCLDFFSHTLILFITKPLICAYRYHKEENLVDILFIV